MDIVFYSCDADTRKLDKSSSMTVMKTVSAHLKEGTSLINPTFRVARGQISSGSYKLSTLNYCYVASFGRYYFITNITLTEGGIIEVECHVDVLMTYKDELIGKKVLVERQENTYSPYIPDPQIKVRSERYYKNYNVGTLPAPSGAYFMLTTNGGASS